MSNSWGFAACVKTEDIFLNTLILARDTRMLAQMIEPRVMLEELDIAAGQGNILEDSPGKRTIAPA
jgi:hypothetical protein